MRGYTTNGETTDGIYRCGEYSAQVCRIPRDAKQARRLQGLLQRRDLKGGTVRASSSRKDIESSEGIVSHKLSSDESCTAVFKAFMEGDRWRGSQ